MVDTFLNEFMFEVVTFGQMIYREAAGEPREGKIAVANTVMNRAAHPKWWGKTPYEVVIAPMQYSSMTCKGDPMTTRYPRVPDDPVMMECIQIAHDAINGKLPVLVPGADSYFATTMKIPPKWADESKFVKQIGRHRFYNLDGDPAIGNAA